MEGAHDDWSWPQPPPGTFRDNLRAMVRRRPGMVARKVGISQLLAPMLVLSVVAGGLALAASSLIDLDPVYVAFATLQPFVSMHLAGVHHRWAALAVAAVAGGAVGAAVVALLPTADWAGILAVCAGSIAAAPAYALVTQVGEPGPGHPVHPVHQRPCVGGSAEACTCRVSKSSSSGMSSGGCS